VDEINEQGGVHGRKLRLIVEDSAYNPQRAVLAAEKLVNHDGIFAMVGHMGTPTNMAAMPVLFEKNVINFLPLTSARTMYEPFHRLKYSFSVPYDDQIRLSVAKLVKEKDLKKICTLYQDDEFGLDVFRGLGAVLKSIDMKLTDKTTYKRGATDFSSQIARMKSNDCDMVVLGTAIRETVGAMAEGRKIGFNPVWVGSNAAYHDLVHKLGGKAVEGLYVAHGAQQPYLDDPSPAIRFWANNYKTKFDEDPNVSAVSGYIVMDVFIRGIQKAGPHLTTESFIKAMDGMTVPTNIFGSQELTFTATKRLGGESARMSQIQDGRFKVVSDYMTP
jgi:branched-chain amino acid transport system substrate-binding protein